MAIPVNIEDLLHKRKIESTRIEFKTGWNPDKIYRTIYGMIMLSNQTTLEHTYETMDLAT